MAKLWLRWLSRIPIIAIAVIAALALPWALSWLWHWLPKQWDVWIIVAITADAALVLLAGIWWLWWRLPRHQIARLTLKIRDPKARADTEDNFRKTVGQALGGAAVLIGAGAAYLQFSQQQRASHELLISNQVSKGFEQLGSKERVVRLGGIYALEGVMNYSEQYHQPVLEALCAFVREGTIGMIVDEKPATDIQAALTVIGRRVKGPGFVDLGSANLRGADLIDADLIDADLSGANLSGAKLEHANLSGYDRGADLSGANLAVADLSDANLSGANLSGAHLNGADLIYANLNGTNLFHADLSGVSLSSTDLRTAHFDGQKQLDQACGIRATLRPGLTLKPCPPRSVAPPLNPETTP